MLRRVLVVFGALSLMVASLATGAGAEEERSAASFTAAPEAVELQSTFQAPALTEGNQKLVPLIVKLDEMPAASYDGSIEGLAATSPEVIGTDKFDADSAASVAYLDYLQEKHAVFEGTLSRAVPAARVTRHYTVVYGGVAVLAPLTSVSQLAALPGVLAVYEDGLEQLDTDTSPRFIGVGRLWRELGGAATAGEGVIVGVIDSGIWPEHPSFSDPDPRGNAYPAPVWGGTGTGDGCNFGDTAFNPNDAPFTCNNKLIGAYDFTDTYKAVIGLIPTEFDSARDSNGHGSHTSSTAAGNGRVEATLLGVPRGRVSGIAPRAHVVMYKGCGLEGCFNSDTLASIQQATIDGVDVVNYSISGGGSPYSDAVSLGFLDAYAAGVLVVPSAGNAGPGADTVAHREPWTLTVGASTTNRHFLASLTLEADNSDTLIVEGATVTGGISTPTPVVFPPAGAELCEATPGGADPFPPGTFSGEIVLCDRGDFARVGKSYNVAQGGAGGMILMNPTHEGLSTDNHFIPSLHIEDTETVAVKAFMASHTGVMGTLTDSAPSLVQGDVMAAFSSRGGPGQSLGISKPDVTAPGVQILAGHTPMPEDQLGGPPGELFQAIQGTSMSAPHATGAAALLVAAHPTWSPGQVKSALMLSARTHDIFKEDGATPADSFDMGSGRILPSRAAEVPLTISDTAFGYLAHEDDLWNANYPSLYLPQLDGKITVERMVHNETGAPLDVLARPINVPGDLIVKVRYQKFTLGTGALDSYGTIRITVDARAVPDGEVRHAGIRFKADGVAMYMPITVVKGSGAVTLDKTCSPTDVAYRGLTDCDIVVENVSLEPQTVTINDRLPMNMRLVAGSVVNGEELSPKKVASAAYLTPVAPPVVHAALDNFASPAGYLDLTLFTPTVVSASDESIANFTVPTFEYAGVSYDTIGIVSNGYIVVGGGSGADVDYINSDLPDATIPNNVLAPFWTDLNPSSGGTVYIELLTDGFDSWTVVEWQGVPNFGDGEPNTFQVWIGWDTDFDPNEDISFTYAAVSDGDGGYLTVGAENYTGTTGGTVYFDGAGTPPAPSFGGGSATCDANWPGPPCFEVDVFSTPGAPGGSHTLSFTMKGMQPGPWTNWAYMGGDGIVGTAIAGETGTVLAP